MPTGSSNAIYAADWFELTNKGVSTVDLTGFKMDDNSHAFGSAVALRNVTSIAAGQSVVFFEGNASGSTDATIQTNFIAAWFGGSAPSGFTMGAYGGSGVGLSANADEVNLFDSGGNFVTGVVWTTTASITASFDNHAATRPGTGPTQNIVNALSAVGQFGAFTAFDSAAVGSPGVIANSATVPEPATSAAICGALALVGTLLRRRAARVQ